MRPFLLTPAFLLGLLLAQACSEPSVYDIPFPASLQGEEFEAAAAKIKERNDEIPKEDQDLLMGYIMRTTVARGLGPAPAGTLTVRQAVEDQRAFLAEQAKARAEEEARVAEALRKAQEAEAAREAERAKLREAVTVGAKSLAVLTPDFRARRYGNEFQTEFVFSNNTDKPVAAFKGVAAYNDAFGQQLKAVQVQYDKPLAPGQTVTWKATAKLNEFLDDDRTLMSTNLDTVTLAWKPTTILFVDGTTMAVAE